MVLVHGMVAVRWILPRKSRNRMKTLTSSPGPSVYNVFPGYLNR